MKILYSSLYPSIILENNIAPNTQIGKILIDDPNNPERRFSLCEHQDMYSSDEEVAKYSRGGEFLENYMSANPLEFARRWLGLGDVYQVIEDTKEFFKFNGCSGRPIGYSLSDLVYFTKDKTIQVVEFGDKTYMDSQIVEFQNKLTVEEKEKLSKEIRKGAIL